DRREQDRRTVDVSLTEAGRTAWADAEKTAQELVRRHFGYGVMTVPTRGDGDGNAARRELPVKGRG
ncbi:hypothetical protein, partial [Streptomyces sp. NPDC005568]